MRLYFRGPPSLLSGSILEDSAASRTLSAEPEEWFPCIITVERTVKITIWNLLMIFTVALRFPLWRGGTTCTLPDKSVLRGKKQTASGYVWNIPLALLFYRWKNLMGFPTKLPSCYGEY